MVVHPPKLLTARRVVTLLTALFVSLSSGTNYVSDGSDKSVVTQNDLFCMLLGILRYAYCYR
jgi:hypothetical protein